MFNCQKVMIYLDLRSIKLAKSVTGKYLQTLKKTQNFIIIKLFQSINKE